MLLFALLVMANIPRALAQTKADLKNEIEQATELFKTKGRPIHSWLSRGIWSRARSRTSLFTASFSSKQASLSDLLSRHWVSGV